MCSNKMLDWVPSWFSLPSDLIFLVFDYVDPIVKVDWENGRIHPNFVFTFRSTQTLSINFFDHEKDHDYQECSNCELKFTTNGKDSKISKLNDLIGCWVMDFQLLAEKHFQVVGTTAEKRYLSVFLQTCMGVIAVELSSINSYTLGCHGEITYYGIPSPKRSLCMMNWEVIQGRKEKIILPMWSKGRIYL